jgi:hypothetical protein
MNIGSERLHVRKFFIGLDITLAVALALPGIIDIHIDIPCITEAA